MDILSVCLAILAGTLGLYYLYSRKTRYFREMGIPYVTPLPILGNMAPTIFRQASMVEVIQRYYNLFPDKKYVGFYEFLTPVIVIRDPELFASIATKHFDSFSDHRSFGDGDLDPLLGKNLFSLRGDHWREMRKVIGPTFTTSKMKMMFELICECTENLSNYMVEEARGGKVVEMKEYMKRYLIDAVATCAFGISVDSMRDPNNEFNVLAQKTMNFEGLLSTKIFIAKSFPSVMKLFRLRVFGEHLTKFFMTLIEDTMKTRQEKGIYRPDMIQILMEAKDRTASDEGATQLSVEDMTAQAFVFFFGGFDSTSTSVCFLLHEVAMHPEVQEKLNAEVQDVLIRTNGKPTYEAIMGLRYLDAVVNETFRLYPLAAFLDRLCVKPFELPPALPGDKPISITPGTSLWYPSYAIHRDPKYYPDPDKFDPSRFLDGDVNQSTYVPFGIGPRFCIGNRFALMATKVALFYLLWKCDFEPCEKTHNPMVYSKTSFVMTARDGFWLKVMPKKKPISVDCNGVADKCEVKANGKVE